MGTQVTDEHIPTLTHKLTSNIGRYFCGVFFGDFIVRCLSMNSADDSVLNYSVKKLAEAGALALGINMRS